MKDNKVIVLASGNKHKVKEIKQLLPEYEIISCKEAGFLGDIEENGKTFYENALIKAKTVSQALNLPCLADDSGICVDALGGEPGIYSARYAGDGVDKHNNELLLKNMQGKANRKAKFVCCMVFYKPNGKIITSTGETYGVILDKEYGENGFGYDPLFFSLDLKKCMGLATDEEKNSVSHRYRAIEGIRNQLK